jgi:hypothetical protein
MLHLLILSLSEDIARFGAGVSWLLGDPIDEM